ncbi:MAG: hypothetical protein HY265_04785, partial [Deltaproteobacteria bacterium]|nr:hypothetical protein [Deltaproteobacteria bacterium]
RQHKKTRGIWSRLDFHFDIYHPNWKDTITFFEDNAVAVGNGANPLIPQTSPDIKVNKWGNITVNQDTGRTSKKGVFSGGDIVRGGATVILAMGDGRKAADSIHEYLATGVW